MQIVQYADPDIFVFLKESAADGQTGLRATSQGMIALEIFEGSVTKDRFIWFLRESIVGPVVPLAVPGADQV